MRRIRLSLCLSLSTAAAGRCRKPWLSQRRCILLQRSTAHMLKSSIRNFAAFLAIGSSSRPSALTGLLHALAFAE